MELRQCLSRAVGTHLIALYGIFCFFAGPLPAQEFQLAPPKIDIGLYQSPLFRDSVVVDLRFALADAEIRYTLDGTVPDKQAVLYSRSFAIHKSCILNAIAMHREFRASDPVKLQFIRTDPKFEPREAWLAVPASVKYPGQGVTTLLDLKKGHNDLNNNQWLGFEGTNLDYTLVLKRPEKPNALILSTLTASGSWIYPPARITVWAGKNKKKGFKKVLEYVPDTFTGSTNPMEEKIYTLPLQKRRARYWRVIVENYGPLPENHPGKGSPAWLFVDEIIMQ